MSAAVCGSKRSFFEDLPTTPNSSSPVAKKLRCSSPIRFSPFSHSPTPSLLDQLRNMFPNMDDQLLVRALEVCGDDLDSAIKSLNELRLGSEKLTSLNDSNANIEKGSVTTGEDSATCEDPSAPRSLPVGGAEWVELFVSEMMSATSVEDARARASKVLESLEKSISARSGAEAAQSFYKETTTLKEQVEVLIRENSILKRAVTIQHERQKEYDERSQEVQQLKQLVSQYQEQLRNLEVNNYALTMHLKQAQQSSSMPGRFHPDVF